MKAGSRYKYKSKVLFKARIDSSILPLDDTLISSNNCVSVAFTRPSSRIRGQEMAAEAAAGAVGVLGGAARAAGSEDECVGTDPPVLGRFESGSV